MVDGDITTDEMSFLLSITGKMTAIASVALQAMEIKPSDLPLAALVIKYSEEIDAGDKTTLFRVGPMLLTTLESLQMSPKARSQATRGVLNGQSVPVKSKFDELREKRTERANRTANSHSAAS